MSRLRRLLDRIELTSVRAALEFVDDRGHRDAAQIAYFALLSFIPLALLLVGAFGLAFDDAEVRERVVNTVFDNVPLARGEDREQLERTVDDALEGAGRLGAASILLLSPPPAASWARCATRSTRRGTSTRARRCCAARRSTSRSCSAAPWCWRCRCR